VAVIREVFTKSRREINEFILAATVNLDWSPCPESNLPFKYALKLEKSTLRLDEPYSSTLRVSFRLVHLDRQPDGRTSFPRNQRPVAFLTPPPRPRFCAEVAARQQPEGGECAGADEPNHWMSDVEHSQNINRCFAESCTFKLDGKSSIYRILLVASRRRLQL
jgi:hypothetical protein